MSFDIVLYSIERLLQKWKRIKLKLLYEQVYVECSTTDVSFHNRNNNNTMSFSECKEHCGKTVELRKSVTISGGNQCTLQRWTSKNNVNSRTCTCRGTSLQFHALVPLMFSPHFELETPLRTKTVVKLSHEMAFSIVRDKLNPRQCATQNEDTSAFTFTFFINYNLSRSEYK